MSDQLPQSSHGIVTKVTPPATDGKFTLYSADNLLDLAPLTWLIDGILPTSGLACIFGASGVGKSFLCLDMVAAVAGGNPWFGHTTQPSTVVYIGLEGQSGFRRRVKAKEVHQCAPFSKLVKFVFDPFDITDLDNPLGLGKLILDEGGADLIVIDTLNRASPGADENSSSAMGDILKGAQALQILTGGLVLFVHHPGKDATRGLRGHSSLFAAMDAVIEVLDDGQVIRWRLAKSKDSEDKISHAFKLAVVTFDGNTGKSITSCVVQEVEGASAPSEPSLGPIGVNQRKVLEAVQNLLVQHRVANHLQVSEGQETIADGVLYDQVLAGIKDTLHWVATKHRQSRTKEAVSALIRMGYFELHENLLSLPAN